MTDATRKQRERDKRRAAGQKRIEVWVPAHAEAAVRAAIERVLGDLEKEGDDDADSDG